MPIFIFYDYIIKDILMSQRSITRLAMGSYFQLAKAIGAPIIPPANSTLLEIINNSDAVPFQPTIPTAGMEFPDDYNYQSDSINSKMQYFAIGSGGHFNITNATNGRPKMGNKPHKARQTGFFDIMPFVAKPLEDDLSPDDRAKYRCRKVVEINGKLYAAYFLRYLDLSAAPITQSIVKKDKGVTASVPYKPTANDAVPKGTEISGESDGTYIQTLIQVDIVFNTQEAQWLREVANLWYGDPEDAIVSEIAICSGVDKPITKRYPSVGNQTPQAVSSSLREAVCVQLNVAESLYHAMTFNNGSVTEKIFIGTEDPLYGKNASTNP